MSAAGTMAHAVALAVILVAVLLAVTAFRTSFQGCFLGLRFLAASGLCFLMTGTFQHHHTRFNTGRKHHAGSNYPKYGDGKLFHVKCKDKVFCRFLQLIFLCLGWMKVSVPYLSYQIPLFFL